MYKCKFCRFQSSDIDNFEIDEKHRKGYWCPCCDGFTFFNKEERSYILYLEDKDKEEEHVKVDFKVHCSPLRYPGGKSKFVGTVLNALREGHTEKFIEPFAGGASVGLSLLLSGKITDLYLNDLDYGIYALFSTIKEDAEALKKRINEFLPDKDSYENSKKHVHKNYEGLSLLDAAWHFLVVNRLAFSGIPFANCMSDASSRWNAKTLCSRIDKISKHKEHIFVSNIDALAFIEEMYWSDNATLFIDPPYYEKGDKLYIHSYKEQDHEALSFLLDELHKEIPSADIIVTYDYVKEIEEMYLFSEQKQIGRKYSIANRIV